MGRQEVVPFLFEVNIIFAGESFAEKIGEGIPSHEDNPTERRSYDDALYKHLCQHRFCVGSPCPCTCDRMQCIFQQITTQKRI